MQITDDLYPWAKSQVGPMQQTCVDEILMANYTEHNDTQSVANATSRALNDLLKVRCEPFDCSGNGRCVSGSCACHWGEHFLPGL